MGWLADWRPRATILASRHLRDNVRTRRLGRCTATMIRRAASRAALPWDDPVDGLVPLRYGRTDGYVRPDCPGMGAARRRASGSGRFAHTAAASAVAAADSSVRPGLASNPAFSRSLQGGG